MGWMVVSRYVEKPDIAIARRSHIKFYDFWRPHTQFLLTFPYSCNRLVLVAQLAKISIYAVSVCL